MGLEIVLQMSFLCVFLPPGLYVMNLVAF